MTQYDRLVSGKATAEEIANEIKASAVKANNYKKIPGHVLVEEYLAPYYWNLSDLSTRSKIPYYKLYMLIRGEIRIDPQMARSLSSVFKQTTENYWLDLQSKYEKNGTL